MSESENCIAPAGSGWVDQLRAAASSDPPSSAAKPNSNDGEEYFVQKTLIESRENAAVGGGSELGADASCNVLEDTVFGTETRPLGFNTIDGGPAVSPPNPIRKTFFDPKVAAHKTHDTQQSAMPPKKMLRVRPDGKLGSPKAKESPQDTTPKRSRRSAVSRTALRKRILIFKYGTDNKSRMAIGHRISRIMSDTFVESSTTKSSKSVPAGPPKATHPFFLGGVARDPGSNPSLPGTDVKTIETDVSPMPAKRRDTSPKRSRVTSKPIDISPDSVGIRIHTFGSDRARLARFPGAMEPTWPPQGMLHIGRGTRPSTINHYLAPDFKTPNAHRKLKGAEVKVQAEEEVLRPCIGLVRACIEETMISQRVTSREWRQFRRPVRRLMSGCALQRAARQRIGSHFLGFGPDDVKDQISDEVNITEAALPPTHKALQYAYQSISTSLTAFDRFECETQEWAHKYAPKTAEEVLQPGREVTLLRDWLKGLRTNAIEKRRGRSRESSMSRKLEVKAHKRKRKRADVLGDFVISSDEEAEEMDEVTDLEDGPSASSQLKRSIIRKEDTANMSGSCDRSANAVIISGPHGSGKTAAVYAVAQELGFEVFEINAGSRRSGRDILDKVGDMTRNHLVSHEPTEDSIKVTDRNGELDIISENLNKDIEAGRQGTMTNFFKAKSIVDNVQPQTKTPTSKASPKKNEAPMRSKNQKQSLILLEEVDVIFEEDKMFWNTTLSLILQSKRPVIMTCTDEQLLPLDDMTLYAILRFKSPPVQLAADYLLLVACNEGHLLSHEAVAALYAAKGSDLRASISELNFFCQMAVGDTKGGLEWMLTTKVSDTPHEERNHSIRVVSENSYQTAMGWLNGEKRHSYSDPPLIQEGELLSEAWTGWKIDVGTPEHFSAQAPVSADEAPGASIPEVLRDWDMAADALSAADTFPACVFRELEMSSLETDIPEFTDSMRSNYTDGSGVLSANPVVDQSGVADSLTVTLRACTRQLSCLTSSIIVEPLDDQLILRMIPRVIQERTHRNHSRKANEFSAFGSLARSTSASLGVPKGPQISAFDGPLSVVAAELAPYVRGIVAYDLRLEEKRHQLNSLFSGPSQEGRRARTTRSSRAALEGGQKAHTRRERWFPKNTSSDLILQSGGTCWQSALLRFMTETSEGQGAISTNETRRSSVGSSMEGDI